MRPLELPATLLERNPRRGGRVVEGARLESVYTVTPYRGFESLSLRQTQKSPGWGFFVFGRKRPDEKPAVRQSSEGRLDGRRPPRRGEKNKPLFFESIPSQIYRPFVKKIAVWGFFVFGRKRPDEDLREALDLDSMDFLNVLIGVHERTGIDIPEADYPQLFTLETMTRYLATRE